MEKPELTSQDGDVVSLDFLDPELQNNFSPPQPEETAKPVLNVTGRGRHTLPPLSSLKPPRAASCEQSPVGRGRGGPVEYHTPEVGFHCLPGNRSIQAIWEPPVVLPYVRLSARASPPTRATPGSAGLDLASTRVHVIPPACQGIISTDIAVAIPEGFYGRLASRSSWAIGHNVHVVGGVIDQDYRGSIVVVLLNLGPSMVVINPGDRVAQLILERCAFAKPIEQLRLPDTTRGRGGFGSTDRHEAQSPLQAAWATAEEA